MAAPPSCTINGFPCLLRSSIVWSFRSGVKPVQHRFELVPQDAATILAARGPLTLNIVSDSGILEVKHLWALRAAETDDPAISAILVADRRWIWEYKHVVRRFNMRRRVGVYRTKPSEHDVVELSKLVDKFAYAPFSLLDPSKGTKWTAGDALANVITEVANFEKKESGTRFRLIYDKGVESRLEDIPMEDLELNDAGDAAIAKVLAYLPQLGLYVDAKGDVHIYERSSGQEASVIAAVGGAVDAGVWGTSATLAKYENTRPREIHVLFTREMEVRFDSFEPTDRQTSTEVIDQRKMTNVLPVPDYTLRKPNGEGVNQGTWIDVADALASPTWAIPVPLTFRKLQQAMVPYIDLWAGIAKIGLAAPDQNWAARVGVLQQHYRFSFQLPRRWVDRTLQIRPYLVGTVNYVGGQRAPSQVFCDYTIIGGQRSFVKFREEGIDAPKYAGNITGYPVGAISETSKPAPARVEIVDDDQGIIRYDFSVDPSRLREIVLPGKMIEETIPSEDPTLAGSFWNAVGAGGSIPTMEPRFRSAVILTLTPAGPNNNQQYHRVIVKPSNAKGMLPPAAASKLASAKGPIMEVYVGPKIETARFQWPYGENPDDVRAVEACFGIPHVLDDTTEDGKALSQRVTRLCVNRATGGNTKRGVSLESLAFGYAAKIWAGEADRYVGEKSGSMVVSALPAGNIDEIRHEIRPDGAVLTNVSMPEDVPQFELAQFLGSQERAVLFRSLRG